MPVAARQTAARPMHGVGHRRIRDRIAQRIAIAGLILAIGRVVIVSMDCQSAAAAAAREFVVTGDESSSRSIAADVAGGEPRVIIAHDGQSTSVMVECSVLPGPLDVTPTRVTGNATAISQ